jgi:adenylate cyclase
MTRITLFRIKNAMLFSNFISNLMGVCIVLFLTHKVYIPRSPELFELGRNINKIFLPISFLLPLILTLLYEKPIRTYVNTLFRKEQCREDFKITVHQRLLNEPFFLIALDFVIWLCAALIYSTMFWKYGAGTADIQHTFFTSFLTGLITITVAFFVFEFVLQKRVVPHLFPDGGLYMTPRTIHIRIRTRLIAFLFACNLIPFFGILTLSLRKFPASLEPGLALEQLRATIHANAMIFIWVGIWLTFLISSNLTKSLQEIIRVLRDVRNGNFDTKVRVTSNDEIGYTGDVINEMNAGLKERDFIKEKFGIYVTSEIRDQILSDSVPLDGELKEVTVLFADLRNFTPMVESTPPQEVVKIINGYFKEMDEAIQNHHGLVLQYIGDEIEAVFGTPIFRDDHPVMAVRAALEMKHRMGMLNQDLKQRGYAPLLHGIGIHTGEVLAANIGSPQRLSYALVGDTVNLASRLQNLNKEHGTEIIMSETTRAHLDDHFKPRKLPAAIVKGKSQPVKIFTIE